MGGTRNGVEVLGEIGALEKVRTLSLPVFDLFVGLYGPASLSCSLIKLAKGLLQQFCQA